MATSVVASKIVSLPKKMASKQLPTDFMHKNLELKNVVANRKSFSHKRVYTPQAVTVDAPTEVIFVSRRIFVYTRTFHGRMKYVMK